MKKLHTRRKRRSAKMTMRSHGKFKVGHKRKGGRTGSSGRQTPGTTDRRYVENGIQRTPIDAATPLSHKVADGLPAKGRHTIVMFGRRVCVEKVLDVINAQEQLERIGARKMTLAPETGREERSVVCRVYYGCITERDLCERACNGDERFVFDAFRRSAPSLRESIRAVLTDLPPRRSPARRALAAPPLGIVSGP